jgi:ATP-dependent DNA helicase RecG
MPLGLSIDELRKPHTSFPANPLIANVFYLADYAQRAGSGTMEMIAECRAQGAPEPEFILVRNNKEFRSILPRDVWTESVIVKLGLNDRQLQAVRFIKEYGTVSRKQYVDLVSISPRQALLDLTDLVFKQVVSSSGKGRNVKYGLRK